jgi:hypothetical protein
MALQIKATDGIAIKALQQAEHAISATPFSCPAQPSHLPDIGMSVGIGISVAMEVDDVDPMSMLANPCMTRLAAKMSAATIAEA